MVKKAFHNALLIQIIAAVVGVIGMVVDGAVTGSCLGTEAMTGFGLASPAVMIFVACSGVCELGSSILIGGLVGARKEKEASVALSSCLAFALGFSLLLSGAVLLFSRQIAAFLGASGSLTDATADYLKGFSLCAPALFMLTTLMPVMQIEGRQKTVVFSVVIMTMVNIAGDLLVGLVLKGGLFGMALATTVSYYAAFFLMIPFLIGKESTIKLSFRCIRFEYIGAMLLGGIPNALQQACRSLLLFLLNKRLLIIADSQAVAAFTVIMSAANLCMALGSGIGSSVSMLTGVFAGDRDERAIRELVKTALRTATVYSAILWAVLFFGAGLFMPVFTSDPALMKLAVTGFRLYSLSMIGYSVNVTLRLYYQAMKLSLLSYVYVFCNSFLFTVLGAFILSSVLGVNGVWLSFLFGETFTLLLLTAWILFSTEKKSSLIDRTMLIPSKLTEGIISRFDANAGDAAGIIHASEQVEAFCTENGADGRTAFALSLCVEELGRFILKNADARRKTVEVRVLRTNDGWIMNIRDNGKLMNPLNILNENRNFNPARILSEEKTDDFSFIGIKLVCKMSKKIEYFDTLNINNLSIEV